MVLLTSLLRVCEDSKQRKSPLAAKDEGAGRVTIDGSLSLRLEGCSFLEESEIPSHGSSIQTEDLRSLPDRISLPVAIDQLLQHLRRESTAKTDPSSTGGKGSPAGVASQDVASVPLVPLMKNGLATPLSLEFIAVLERLGFLLFRHRRIARLERSIEIRGGWHRRPPR